MFIYTQDRRIVNIDRMEVIYAKGDGVYAVAPDDSCIGLGLFEDTREAQQKVQEIMQAIDHGRNVYYIGEFDLPF